MPLYSYIANYRGATYVDQDSRSNFKGFASLLLARMPQGSLPGMNTTLQSKLVDAAARAEWVAVPNHKNLWLMQIEIDSQPFTLHAVQTQI